MGFALVSESIIPKLCFGIAGVARGRVAKRGLQEYTLTLCSLHSLDHKQDVPGAAVHVALLPPRSGIALVSQTPCLQRQSKAARALPLGDNPLSAAL